MEKLNLNTRLIIIGSAVFSLVLLSMSDIYPQPADRIIKAQGPSATWDSPFLNNKNGNGPPKYAPGEVLVGLKEGSEDVDLDAIVSQINKQRTGTAATTAAAKTKRSKRIHNISQVTKKAKKHLSLKGLSVKTMNDEQLFKESYKAMPAREKALYRDYKIKLPEGVSVQEAIVKLRASPYIAYAEANHLNELFTIPNDPYYFSSNSWNQGYDDLWGIKKIQCADAWDIAEGEGITAAVVDTGVDYNHGDIAANIWVNTLEIPDNGIDDDGNGYIDDVRGWDFSGDDAASIIEDNDPMDTAGHGTHVAGTIAAIGNNNIGVIGVAPKSRILPVKVFPHSFDDVCAKGIKYAVDNGARITNNSWGGMSNSTTLYNAFEYAHDKGVVSVAAAGNYNMDSNIFTPARYQNVITVAATDHNDIKSDYSNWGKVDVAAPGGDYTYDVLSLRAENMGTIDFVVGVNYFRASGTSMAASHVSGLAALILSKNPLLVNEEIRQIIAESADDMGPVGWDRDYGYGRVNAYKALDMVSRNIMPLVAHISSCDYSHETKTITIKGVVCGDGFSSYQIELGTGLEPADFTIIETSTLPVRGGVLAEIANPDLQEGYYTIKLVTHSLSASRESRISRYYSPNFVSSFSTLSGYPYDVAVDENRGLVYVSEIDILNLQSFISKYDAEGRFLTRWPVGYTVGIAIDEEGYIWTAESFWTTNKIICKYDSEGNLIANFGDRKEYSPNYLDVAIDKNGDIYVSEVTGYGSGTAAGRVKKFDKDGVFLMDIGAERLIEPLGVAIDYNYLYVADHKTNKILKFTAQGQFVSEWGSAGDGDGQLSAPSFIAADGHNKIYVADGGNSRIQIFDREGNFLHKFGSEGDQDGQFYSLAFNGIYVYKGAPRKYLYVTDMFNCRAQKFTVFNRAPVLVPIGDKTVNSADQLLKFEVDITDLDEDILSFGVNGLPFGAQFVTAAGEVPAQAQVPGLYGDLDLDGKITFDDVNYLSKSMETLSEIQKVTADVDGDGSVDFNDIETINEYAYGARNFFPVIVRYGDVNLDGGITVEDVNYLSKNMETLSEIQKVTADVDGDGRAGSDDIAIINEFVTGARSSFPTITKRFFIWKPSSAQAGTYPNVSFSATDGKEIVSEAVGIIVDFTAPRKPVVTDEGTYANSKTSLSASWTSSDAQSGIAQYLYRITRDSRRGAVIRGWTSTGTATSVIASGLTLTQGKTYYFSVRSKNRAGLWSRVGYSNGIKVVIAAPTSLTAVSSGGLVTLNWLDNATNETGYVVEESFDNVTFWAVPATLGADTKTFIVTALPFKAYYRVYAYNEAGRSANSNTVVVNPPGSKKIYHRRH